MPAASSGYASPSGSSAAANAATGLNDADQSNLSRARGYLNSARSLVESRRTDGVEETVVEALKILDQLPPPATTALRAQASEIRGKLAQALAAETARRATGEINRHLSRAESDIEALRIDSVNEALARVTMRLSEHDIRSGLTPNEIDNYEQRVGVLRDRLAAALKRDALDRVFPLLGELEIIVRSDPYAGLDHYRAQDRSRELAILRSRVMGGLRNASETDPDIKAVIARVIATDQAIEAASTARGTSHLESSITNSWELIEKDTAHWQVENDSTDPAQLQEPELPRTRMALQRTRILLEDPQTLKIRADNVGNATINAPFETAERTLEAVGRKLASAYNRVLDAGEKLATPMSQLLLVRPSQLALNASALFEHTPHRDAIVSRARKLDEKWKTEVAATMKARQETYDQLTAEAELKWPRLREAFTSYPVDPGYLEPGTIVRIDRAYNRCGWDYSSRAYVFAARVNDIVLGGTYAPHVLDALEHAWYDLQLDVNDRIAWDLIAVIEGPGTIGVRTTVTLREQSSGRELGNVEEWPETECVRIRIIGLHAGPVAIAQH